VQRRGVGQADFAGSLGGLPSCLLVQLTNQQAFAFAVRRHHERQLGEAEHGGPQDKMGNFDQIVDRGAGELGNFSTRDHTKY
jgi:hypothetical protein